MPLPIRGVLRRRARGPTEILSKLLILAVGFAGCASLNPAPRALSLAPPASFDGIEAAAVSTEAPDPAVLARWWEQLGDPLLARWIERAQRASTDVRAAQARLRAARARRGLSEAERWPTVTAAGSLSVRDGAEGDDRRESYRQSLELGWDPDLFGAKRSAAAAAQAELEATVASLEEVQVELAAEVALAYLELRSLEARLGVLRRQLASQEETHELVRWRFLAGLTSELDLEQATSLTAQTRARIPSLEAGLVQVEQRLAVLLAAPAAELASERAAAQHAAGQLPRVPTGLAVGIPAEALWRRPDVRAAERQLAAEAARRGEARAARYPTLSLSASLGSEALSLDDLTDAGSLVGSLLAGLVAPIFDRGRIERRIEIQDAAEDEASARYEAVLRQALAEVAQALASLTAEQARGAALAAAADAARRASELAGLRYGSGLADFESVLSAERSLLELEQSAIESQAQAVSAMVRLYQALGGGWSPAEAVLPLTDSKGERS